MWRRERQKEKESEGEKVCVGGLVGVKWERERVEGGGEKRERERVGEGET